MIVHVAFLGFKPECWTPCPKAGPYEPEPAHKWVMGDEDDCVWCMWCSAVAWHTYKGNAPRSYGWR